MQNLFRKTLTLGSAVLIAAALALPASAAEGMANPCAPKGGNPCASKANPCAPAKDKAKAMKKGKMANPCAPANPCAAKPANPCAKK